MHLDKITKFSLFSHKLMIVTQKSHLLTCTNISTAMLNNFFKITFQYKQSKQRKFWKKNLNEKMYTLDWGCWLACLMKHGTFFVFTFFLVFYDSFRHLWHWHDKYLLSLNEVIVSSLLSFFFLFFIFGIMTDFSLVWWLSWNFIWS